MATKRKLAALAPEEEDPVDPSDELMFLCLGGGNEVGRSCHIIQYKGKTVMVCRKRSHSNQQQTY
jgi:cleavage and polyadenylation specificity factor subunit 3